jgi:hypothetical protein
VRATGLFKSPAALQNAVIVQQFNRQGPAVNMSGGTQAKAKNQLAHPAAQFCRFLAVGGQLLKKGLA